MKKLKYALLVFISLIPLTVNASEGTVYSPRTCFGITYGTHDNHWHKAIQTENGYIAEGDPIYTYPCTPSNDPTLKALTVNGNTITVADQMEFKTYDETALIVATPNYQYSKVEYEQQKALSIGPNTVSIKVTSAGGLTKTYELNIIREKVLSTNNNIKTITIDGKNYKFKNNTIDNLFITSNHHTLNIKATPEDETAKITIEGNDKLKAGDGTITIICTSESGAKQEYYIKYHKSMVVADIVGTAIGILILLLPIILIIFIFAQKNKKKYINKTHRYKKYIK